MQQTSYAIMFWGGLTLACLLVSTFITIKLFVVLCHQHYLSSGPYMTLRGLGGGGGIVIFDLE
jgi:hypothetical protein